MTSNVLLVEANPHIVEQMESALIPEGYCVIVAASGREALSLYSNPFGLLLVDELLPDMSGFQFLEVLQQSLQGAQRPATIMLIKGGDSSISEDYTPDIYLIRAFHTQELLMLIRQLNRWFVERIV